MNVHLSDAEAAQVADRLAAGATTVALVVEGDPAVSEDPWTGELTHQGFIPPARFAEADRACEGCDGRAGEWEGHYTETRKVWIPCTEAANGTCIDGRQRVTFTADTGLTGHRRGAPSTTRAITVTLATGTVRVLPVLDADRLPEPDDPKVAIWYSAQTGQCWEETGQWDDRWKENLPIRPRPGVDFVALLTLEAP